MVCIFDLDKLDANSLCAIFGSLANIALLFEQFEAVETLRILSAGGLTAD